jgi:hypothetical protein
MATAELVWIALVVILVVLAVVIGGIDLWLSLTGQPTITTFLRLSPRWFLFPAIAIVAFVAALAVHLFVE